MRRIRRTGTTGRVLTSRSSSSPAAGARFRSFCRVNAMVLLGQILAGVTFYLVCRFLRYRWEWAFAASVAFAMSHYAFQRGMPHLTLTYYWHIPLCLLVVWWCGSRRGLRLSGRRFWISVAVAVITSVQSAYYTNVLLQFLGLAAFAHLLAVEPLEEDRGADCCRSLRGRRLHRDESRHDLLSACAWSEPGTGLPQLCELRVLRS